MDCGTCKHWDPHPYGKPIPGDPYGTCKVINKGDPGEGDVAFVAADRGYEAYLMTRQEFSCNLYKEKETTT